MLHCTEIKPFAVELTAVAEKGDVDVVANRKQPHGVAKDTCQNSIGVDENYNEFKPIILSIYNMNTFVRSHSS